MSFVGIVGRYENKRYSFTDKEGIPPIGNGKTMTMEFYLYKAFLKKFEVYQNVKAEFSQLIKAKELLSMLENQEIKNAYIGIDEITKFLNSMGAPVRDTIYAEGIFGQIRKLHDNVYWTGQNYISCNKRVRNLTNIILRPEKVHLDYSLCFNPLCKKEHLIIIYSEKPFISEPIEKPLIASVVGKLFDTDFFIDEKPLNIPKSFNNEIETDKELNINDIQSNGIEYIKIPKNTSKIVVNEIKKLLKIKD